MKNLLSGLAGLALGAALGIFGAWGFAPAPQLETTPAALRADFKADYRLLIALAFRANPDPLRAQARLATLGDPEPVKSLREQSQQMLANQAPLEVVQLLADLATALENQPAPDAATTLAASSPIPVASFPTLEASPSPLPPASVTPAQSPTPSETPPPPPTPLIFATPRPTRTATFTPGAPFQLVNQTNVCQPGQPSLLQVFLTGPNQQPIPGVELVLTWLGGEEHFFSGLKPEIDPGYADYRLTEKVEYALSLSAGSTRLTGLTAPLCLEDPNGQAYYGGLRLEFRQP